MNEHSLNDPLLQSLEARLAAGVPRVSAAEQQQMLYQCAFAAGRHASVRTMRRWQAATATLAAIVVAFGLPQFISRNQVAVQPPVRPSSSIVIDSPKPVPQPAVQLTERTGIQLDAWQLPHSDDSLHSQMLAHHDATDSSVNSLRTLTRQFLE